MGHSPKPLRFLVPPELAAWPEFQALAAKGHTVHTRPDDGNPWTYDAIFGPSAWRMTKAHVKYLDIAVAAARKARYPA